MEQLTQYKCYQVIDKMRSEKNKTIVYGILVFVVLLVSLYMNITSLDKIGAMNKALKTLDKDFEEQKTTNLIIYDSLESIVAARKVIIEKLEIKQNGFSIQLSNIKNKSNAAKKEIINITDADSLADVISRRYR